MRLIIMCCLCFTLSSCDLISSPNQHTSRSMQCSFKVPEGFKIAQEEKNNVTLIRDDEKLHIIVVHHIGKNPITDENINATGGSFVTSNLGIDNIYDIDKVVKLYGNRKVSGRKAAWFYYPDEKLGVLVYRVFIGGKGNSLYEIAFMIAPQENYNEALDEADKTIDSFLDGFKIHLLSWF